MSLIWEESSVSCSIFRSLASVTLRYPWRRYMIWWLRWAVLIDSKVNSWIDASQSGSEISVLTTCSSNPLYKFSYLQTRFWCTKTSLKLTWARCSRLRRTNVKPSARAYCLPCRFLKGVFHMTSLQCHWESHKRVSLWQRSPLRGHNTARTLRL